MVPLDPDPSPEETLRNRAERAVQMTQQEVADMDAVDVQRLVHDLQVHQVELELQNEELRQTQLALTDAHQRYHQLYNLAPVGYLSLDAAGLIQEVNQMACTLLEVEETGLVGRSLQSFLQAEDADQLSTHFRELPGSDTHPTWDVHLELPSQAFRVLHLNMISAPEPVAEQDSYRVTLVDVTDRVQAEEEKRRFEALLRQGQKLESLGTLAGGIAHEFNNVLSILALYLELATQDLPADSPVQHHLETMDTVVDRATSIVQQILAFSRQGEIKRQAVNLATVVKSTAELVRAALPQTIELRLDIDEEESVVWADETQLHQVLLNLCSNAEYAMRDTIGHLDLHVKHATVTTAPPDYPQVQPGVYACLSVHNSGPAIPVEVQDRLFEPFFTTKGVGDGSGMGLSIVHGIITDHGGMMTV